MTLSTNKTILTLDAGGTNFVFSALQGGREIIEPTSVPAPTNHLDKCLNAIKSGFEQVRSRITPEPDAISFAFPGPADYEAGIIGNLPNFPAMNGNVPLKAILEEHFQLPVFINNDGNLFAMGEAFFGSLPEVNKLLEAHDSRKHFRNLIGITLGTGFGCGIIVNGSMISGDNSCAGEIHNTLNVLEPEWNAEESVSSRAILREYQNNVCDLTPEDIYEIAIGRKSGERENAVKSFIQFGKALGHSIVNAVTFIDGLIVLGGGLVQGFELFYPSMWKVIRSQYSSPYGDLIPRLSYPLFDLDQPNELKQFLNVGAGVADQAGSGMKHQYNLNQRSGIIRSRLGTNKAVFLGAYAYALQNLES